MSDDEARDEYEYDDGSIEDFTGVDDEDPDDPFTKRIEPMLSADVEPRIHMSLPCLELTLPSGEKATVQLASVASIPDGDDRDYFIVYIDKSSNSLVKDSTLVACRALVPNGERKWQADILTAKEENHKFRVWAQNIIGATKSLRIKSLHDIGVASLTAKNPHDDELLAAFLSSLKILDKGGIKVLPTMSTGLFNSVKTTLAKKAANANGIPEDIRDRVSSKPAPGSPVKNQESVGHLMRGGSVKDLPTKASSTEPVPIDQFVPKGGVKTPPVPDEGTNVTLAPPMDAQIGDKTPESDKSKAGQPGKQASAPKAKPLGKQTAAPKTGTRGKQASAPKARPPGKQASTPKANSGSKKQLLLNPPSMVASDVALATAQVRAAPKSPLGKQAKRSVIEDDASPKKRKVDRAPAKPTASDRAAGSSDNVLSRVAFSISAPSMEVFRERVVELYSMSNVVPKMNNGVKCMSDVSFDQGIMVSVECTGETWSIAAAHAAAVLCSFGVSRTECV